MQDKIGPIKYGYKSDTELFCFLRILHIVAVYRSLYHNRIAISSIESCAMLSIVILQRYIIDACARATDTPQIQSDTLSSSDSKMKGKERKRSVAHLYVYTPVCTA